MSQVERVTSALEKVGYILIMIAAAINFVGAPASACVCDERRLSLSRVLGGLYRKRGRGAGIDEASLFAGFVSVADGKGCAYARGA